MVLNGLRFSTGLPTDRSCHQKSSQHNYFNLEGTRLSLAGCSFVTAHHPALNMRIAAALLVLQLVARVDGLALPRGGLSTRSVGAARRGRPAVAVAMAAGPPHDGELTATTNARGAVLNFDPLGIATESPRKSASAAGLRLSPALAMLAMMAIAEPASAAGGEDIAVPSALVAYGHFLSFGIAGASLTAERLTIKPNMTPAEEDIMSIADSVYGEPRGGVVVW